MFGRGTVVDEKYRIEEPIGFGGMGHVYKAQQMALDRSVAVKVLKPELVRVTGENHIERFMREARLAASLNHPNLVRVYDAGAVEDIYYIVMEYLEGKTIKEHMLIGEVPAETVLDWFEQVCAGLQVAHDAGLIHRDLKPSNIHVGSDGVVRIMDFGLAREVTGDMELTRTGEIYGTPLYMSPEQWDGAELDGRTDLYSLGATFYHLAAGDPPYKAQRTMAMIIAQMQEKPIPLQTLRGDVTPLFAETVMRLLLPNPVDRYPTAREAAEAASGRGSSFDSLARTQVSGKKAADSTRTVPSDLAVDLHIHTLFSDGPESPSETVRQAKEAGLDVMAITDHDTLEGLPSAIEAARGIGIGFVPGIELTTHLEEIEIHMLGYFIDPADRVLRRLVQDYLEGHQARIREILDKLRKKKVELELWEVLGRSRGARPTRDTIANLIVKKGYVKRFGDAYRKYLKKDAPCYVPPPKMDTLEAIRAVHEAGGIAVIAHPGKMKLNQAIVKTLRNLGMDGLEVYHPAHDDADIRYWGEVAESLGFLVTGGTDYHGPQRRGYPPLGTAALPGDLWQKLRAAANR